MMAKAFAAGLGAALLAGAAQGAERVTQPFRTEHVVIKEHLGHIEQMVASVEAAEPGKLPAAMGRVVNAFEDHIAAHAAWEEQYLYPVVDRLAGTGEYPFTAAMVQEHRIVGRWIGELREMQQSAAPDARAFARRATMLLGLIHAHFEDEEEVLLPVIDAKMSQADFEREVLAHDQEHAH